MTTRGCEGRIGGIVLGWTECCTYTAEAGRPAYAFPHCQDLQPASWTMQSATLLYQLTVASCKHLLHQVGVRVVHRHKPAAAAGGAGGQSTGKLHHHSSMLQLHISTSMTVEPGCATAPLPAGDKHLPSLSRSFH